jgi:hypothetical protein
VELIPNNSLNMDGILLITHKEHAKIKYNNCNKKKKKIPNFPIIKSVEKN